MTCSNCLRRVKWLSRLLTDCSHSIATEKPHNVVILPHICLHVYDCTLPTGSLIKWQVDLNVVDGWDLVVPLREFFPFEVEADLDSVSITAYNRCV